MLNKHNFKPHEIFSCDETGLTCDHKPVKFIPSKGKRCVSSATSGERGQTTTILVAYSASGACILPMMIFKRKRNKPALVDHAPAGTVGSYSPSGWIYADLFLAYLKHFVAFTKFERLPSVVDAGWTHTKVFSTIEFAPDNGVVIMSLPPHTSHKLQPLDRSFFKTLKSAFNAACSTWMRNHPGRRITVDKLGELFNAAYLKSATIENAVSGFRCTGIVPFNKEFLPLSDFLEEPRVGDPPSDKTLLSPLDTTKQSTNDEETTTVPLKESTPVPSEETTPVPSQEPPVPEKPPVDHISFTVIMKLPSLTEKKKSKRSEESKIITSSSYKQSLVESIAQQNQKIQQKLLAKEKKLKKAEAKAMKQPKAKKARTDSKKSEKLAKNVSKHVVEDSQCPMCKKCLNIFPSFFMTVTLLKRLV